MLFFLKAMICIFLSLSCSIITAADHPSLFPDCTAPRTPTELNQKKAAIQLFLSSLSEQGKPFLQQYFPGGLPSTIRDFNNNNPQAKYTEWYNARQATMTAASTASAANTAQLEQKRREAETRALKAQQDQQAAEAIAAKIQAEKVQQEAQAAKVLAQEQQKRQDEEKKRKAAEAQALRAQQEKLDVEKERDDHKEALDNSELQVTTLSAQSAAGDLAAHNSRFFEVLKSSNQSLVTFDNLSLVTEADTWVAVIPYTIKGFRKNIIIPFASEHDLDQAIVSTKSKSRVAGSSNEEILSDFLQRSPDLASLIKNKDAVIDFLKASKKKGCYALVLPFTGEDGSRDSLFFAYETQQEAENAYENAELFMHAGAAKAAGFQRPTYNIILTPRPPKQENEPPTLTSLMDSYYHTIEAANQIAMKSIQMEGIALEVAQKIMPTLESSRTADEALDIVIQHKQTLINGDMNLESLIQKFFQPLVANARSEAEVFQLISPYKVKVEQNDLNWNTIRRGLVSRFSQKKSDGSLAASGGGADAKTVKKNEFDIILMESMEDFYEQMAAAKDFSNDVNSLLLKTIQKYGECIETLKSIPGLFKPSCFAIYTQALGEDRKLAEKWIKEEQQRLIDAFRADLEVENAFKFMQSTTSTIKQVLSDNVKLMTPLPAVDREKEITKHLKHATKRTIAAVPICYFFTEDPMWFFVILNDNKQFMKDFFAGKSNAFDNDSKFDVFTQDLKKLNLSQKKALFIMVETLIENFEALEKAYVKMSYSTNKIKLSDIKLFSNYLRKVIVQEQALPHAMPQDSKSGYTFYEPSIRACEMTSKQLALSADLPNSLPQQYRINKLTSLLDRNNNYVRTLTLQVTDKSWLSSAFSNPDDAQVLIECWDYLQNARSAEQIVAQESEQNVDQEIKTLQKGEAILNVESNQTRLNDWIRQATGFSTTGVAASTTSRSSKASATALSSSSASSSSKIPPDTVSKAAFSGALGGLIGAQLKTKKAGGASKGPVAIPSNIAPTVTAPELLDDVLFIEEKINSYSRQKGIDPTTVPPFSKYLLTLPNVKSRLQAIAANSIVNPADVNEVRLKAKSVKPLRAMLENPTTFVENTLAEIENTENTIQQYTTDANFRRYITKLEEAKTTLATLKQTGNITLDNLQAIDGAYEKAKEVKDWAQ